MKKMKCQKSQSKGSLDGSTMGVSAIVVILLCFVFDVSSCFVNSPSSFHSVLRTSSIAGNNILQFQRGDNFNDDAESAMDKLSDKNSLVLTSSSSAALHGGQTRRTTLSTLSTAALATALGLKLPIDSVQVANAAVEDSAGTATPAAPTQIVNEIFPLNLFLFDLNFLSFYFLV